jgi:hypothetical protein
MGKLSTRTELFHCRSNPMSNFEGEDEMPLVNVVVAIVLVGLLLWLINRFIPMQGTIKGILNGVVVIALVIWLLKVFGLLNAILQYHV